MNTQQWVLVFLTFSSSAAFAKQAPLVSIPTHDTFFSSIAHYCDKAFEGKVVVDNQPSSAFEEKLVMFVRKCDQAELQIPFYVGDNASRTWIIKKTGSWGQPALARVDLAMRERLQKQGISNARLVLAPVPLQVWMNRATVRLANSRV